MSELEERDAEMRTWAYGILTDRESLRGLVASIDGPDALARGVLPEVARSWLHERRGPVSVPIDAVPRFGWMPASIRTNGAEHHLAWMHLEGERPREPFFESTLRIAGRRLVNRLVRPETPLSRLSGHPEGRAPDGFVFHMSRCGSTLVSQVVANLTDSLSISESPAIDAVLRIIGNATDPASIGMLRAIVGAHDDGGAIAAGRFVVKLDSWHVPFLPVLTMAFPSTPWVILTRAPLEILVSHRRRPGIQTVPGMLRDVPDLTSAPSPADHLAGILAGICDAAVRYRRLGRGIVIDYADLPHAIEERLLPHFGIVPDACDRSRISRTMRRDSKMPTSSFVPDGEGKRQEVDAVLLQVAGPIMRSYQRLLDA